MNKIYSFLIVLLSCFLTTSCITNKDLVYIQKAETASESDAIQPVAIKPYRVKVNDVLSVTIKALDQKLVAMFNPSPENALSRSDQSLYFDGFTVDDHGNIRVPVLGELQVLGMTFEEIRQKIEKQLLEEYLNKEADLFVTVKLGGLRYTINGEIGSPGTKTLFQDKVTILEAIANSGDITLVGNRKDVVIVRQFPHGTEIHTVDLTSVEVMKSPYYYVQPNDYIYIKPLKQKTRGFGTNGLQTVTTLLSTMGILFTTYLLIKNN